MSVVGWFKNLFSGDQAEPEDSAAEDSEQGVDTTSSSADTPTRVEEMNADQKIAHYTDALLEPLAVVQNSTQRADVQLDDYFPPDSATPHTHMLAALAALDPAAAVRLMRRYEMEAPAHPGVLLHLARLYDQRRDLDAAFATWSRLAECPALAADAYERMASIAERRGEPESAVVHYQNALVAHWSLPGAARRAIPDARTRSLVDACHRLDAHLPPAPPPPPVTIVTHEPPDGYRIEHPLGRGGFGTVYLARDETLDRPVALKFLHTHLRRRPDKVAELFSEARLIAGLDTTGVVGLYELDGERAMMVLEYMTHGTLADRLVANRPLSPRAALDCLSGVCDVLAVVHERGLVHRDIKPANVLFRGENEPVLGDFGIAGLEDQGRAHAGTRRYAAPELDTGAIPDRRADVYGVGLLLAEMLTATPPPLDPRRRAGWIAQAASMLPDALQQPTHAWLARVLAPDPAARVTRITEVATAAAALSYGIDAPEDALAMAGDLLR